MLDLVPNRLRRNAAATYLRERHGLPCETATLAKYACLGGGPKFYKPSTKIVLYDRDELDRWAAEKLGRPLASTSDAA